MRYESQRNRPNEEYAEQLDEFYGTGEHFQALWFHAQREHLKEWLEKYVELESEASQIRIFHPLFIPGLFQTKRYARATLEAGYISDIDQRLETRMARQTILTRENAPPLVWAVVDEVALLRPFGGPEVMNEQLAHLLALSELPNVCIQTVPLSAGGYLGQDGGFVILTLPDRNVGYVEARFGGRLIQNADEVCRLGIAHDRIRAKALHDDATRDLIKTVMEAMK